MSLEQANPTNNPTEQEIKAPQKEIQFSKTLAFRPVDGNFEVLKLSDRSLTNQDIIDGLRSWGDKANFVFSILLDGLPIQLYDPKMELSPERRAIVESLKAGQPTFIALNKHKIDENFVEACEMFAGSQPGIILLPESKSILHQISGLKLPNGDILRMMLGKNQKNLDDFTTRLNLITPKTEIKKLSEEKAVYAREFICDGERPITISLDEMEDWLSRVKASGLIFEFDVGEKDSSLDNFIRKDGKIFWIDGNILGAKIAKNIEDLDVFVEKQRRTLSGYIKKS
ncbi:MAG: hypothetical protein NTV62_02055 [Candidatus Gribaldobacteria bacterium]|nr:hypothetical protein [Candidatus Gribaldobacteria bacterium]